MTTTVMVVINRVLKNLCTNTCTGWGKINITTRKLLYLRNAWIFFHQILLICLAQNCTLMYCFVLHLLDICQIDGNANFKNEFHNWTKSWFHY